jgi:hypothetical protein
MQADFVHASSTHTPLAMTLPMSLPRHHEARAHEAWLLSKELHNRAFVLWAGMDMAASAQDRFVRWQLNEMSHGHAHILHGAKMLDDFAHRVMALYLHSPNKRGYTMADQAHVAGRRRGAHPHSIANVLESIVADCRMAAKYICDCKCMLDADSHVEPDCDLCLRPRRADPGPFTRSRKSINGSGGGDDRVVCSQCQKSWCMLCAQAMASPMCPYCRKEW